MRGRLKSLLERSRRYLAAPVWQRLDSIEGRLAETAEAIEQLRKNTPAEVTAQRLLWLEYRRIAGAAGPGLSFGDVGFRCCSQTDEDGILLYIFGVIGAAGRTSVEICCADGIECNTANLVIHHGWRALMVDGDANRIDTGRRFYASHRDTRVHPPVMVTAWVTAENVDDVIARNGFSGEIALLSIDVDGNDYWIWKAISVVQPRVVVVEYQDILGPERSWTIPYRPDFKASDYPVNRPEEPNYAGASLTALVRLARRKGYRLVGCNRYGYNAFFVRNDLGDGLLPEVPAESCFTHPKVVEGMQRRFPLVARHEWQEV